MSRSHKHWGDDEALIISVTRGDAAAKSALQSRYQRLFAYVARKRAESTGETATLTDALWAHVLKSLPRWQPKIALRYFVQRTAHEFAQTWKPEPDPEPVVPFTPADTTEPSLPRRRLLLTVPTGIGIDPAPQQPPVAVPASRPTRRLSLLMPTVSASEQPPVSTPEPLREGADGRRRLFLTRPT